MFRLGAHSRAIQCTDAALQAVSMTHGMSHAGWLFGTFVPTCCVGTPECVQNEQST